MGAQFAAGRFCKKKSHFLLYIPGGCGITSPVYSALPQELLLELDPRRPGIIFFKKRKVLEKKHQVISHRENTYTAVRISRMKKQSKMLSCHWKAYKPHVTHFCSNRAWRWGSQWMELLPFLPPLAGKLLTGGEMETWTPMENRWYRYY